MSPRVANCRASAWTLLTSGQVASITSSRRSCAVLLTAGDTPCAEKTTVAPVGNLVELLDEDCASPFEIRDDVLVVHDLLAHVDGRPRCASASSTISIARSTPAQNERGLASSTWRGPIACGPFVERAARAAKAAQAVSARDERARVEEAAVGDVDDDAHDRERPPVGGRPRATPTPCRRRARRRPSTRAARRVR